MALRIRTTIAGEHKFLDIYEDEPVLISLSFAELEDITKKNSAFSQSFQLPGTKNNNEIFNFYYDINSIPVDFDPNLKFETILMWDGFEILQGNIRLDSVTINRDEIIYSVTFYNQIGDLAANIGDKFLRETNLDHLSHPYYPSVVLESNIDPNLFPLTGTTNYSYQNGKTFFGLYNIGYNYLSGTTLDYNTTPLLNFSPFSGTSTGSTYYPIVGYFDNQLTPVRDYYFKPTIQIKELYESICRDAGYNVESNFFDTSYFQKYYLPLKFLDETVYSKNSIIPCFKYSNPLISGVTSPSTYYTGFTNPSINQTCNNIPLSANTTTFIIPSGLSNPINFKFTYTVEVDRTCNLDDPASEPSRALFVFYDGYQQVPLSYLAACSDEVGLKYDVSFTSQFNFSGTSNMSFYFKLSGAFVTNFTLELLGTPQIIAGQIFDYAKEFPDNDYKQIDFITSINKFFNLVVVPDPNKPRTLIVEPVIDYIGKGAVLDWTTKIDHNYPIQVQPTTSIINGTLNFEFRLDQDYANQNYKSASNRIFGTERKNLGLDYKNNNTVFDTIFSSPIDVTINSAYDGYCTLNSMAKVQQQDVSGQTIQNLVPFKILPKVVFRGLTSPNENYGYVGGTGNTASTYCKSGITLNVTDDGYIKFNDCAGNQYYDYVSFGTVTYPDCYDPTSFNAGFPYPEVASFTITSSGTTCGGNQYANYKPYQTWWMNTTEQDRFTNINHFTTYPFNYVGFSHYINWRGEDVSTIEPKELVFPAEDMYDIYYKDYIDDLTSAENKIVSAKIYLYPQDIQQLYWNEKILVNNSYFRINKINNFNMLEPGLCDIELIKLTKDYRSHRVKYYRLVSCDPMFENLYTSSDLNYNLYAYIGNYVKVYDDNLNYLGCFQVQADTYNSNNQYSHYYINSGYTTNSVAVYSDCTCTGRTPFTLVQEAISPTPTPTPTMTPTPSSTPPASVIYEVELCGGGEGPYLITISSGDLPAGIGQAFKFYKTGTPFDGSKCWEVLQNPAVGTADYTGLNSYSVFSNCTVCNAAPATPSPTPTMTITPSRSSG